MSHVVGHRQALSTSGYLSLLRRSVANVDADRMVKHPLQAPALPHTDEAAPEDDLFLFRVRVSQSEPA